MKEKELRLYATCSMCRKLIGHSGLPLFWRVTLEQFGIDGHAVRRQMGLTDFMGGSARLAMAMGPDEEMTKTLTEKVTLCICYDCAVLPTLMIAAAAEWPDVLQEKKEPA